MTNNDIIRRLRYTFNYNDSKMLELFASAEYAVSQDQVHNWLRKEEADNYELISDEPLAAFLNGMINENRGKREGKQPNPEKKLNNNIIFRKLKIALNLKDTDVLEIMLLADFKLSKHELSAFFRKPSASQYMVCKDQILRNFLHGLQLRYRR